MKGKIVRVKLGKENLHDRIKALQLGRPAIVGGIGGIDGVGGNDECRNREHNIRRDVGGVRDGEGEVRSVDVGRERVSAWRGTVQVS